MEERIFVDGWQMQCCGDPFSVGSTVTWTVYAVPGTASEGDVTTEIAPPVMAFEDHHDSAPSRMESVTGRVDAIGAAFARYQQPEPGSKSLVMIAGSVVVESRSNADGWEDEDDERHFCGYVVELIEVKREPIMAAQCSRLRRLVRR